MPRDPSAPCPAEGTAANRRTQRLCRADASASRTDAHSSFPRSGERRRRRVTPVDQLLLLLVAEGVEGRAHTSEEFSPSTLATGKAEGAGYFSSRLVVIQSEPSRFAEALRSRTKLMRRSAPHCSRAISSARSASESGSQKRRLETSRRPPASDTRAVRNRVHNVSIPRLS